MTDRPGSAGRPRYGAIELKDSMQLYWMTGLGLAIAIHLAVVFSYKLAGVTDSGETGVIYVRPVHIGVYLPLPINPDLRTSINIAERGVKRSVGTPVPVPDPIADPGQELAPNVDFTPEGTAVNGGEAAEYGGEIKIPEPDAVPPPFQPVEEMPKIIKRVPPVYPELAIKANLEGTVYLKFWVDKEGNPRDVSVVQSTADIFNEPAITAATQFLFIPAYMNAGPVAVWITMPFRFRLADRK